MECRRSHCPRGGTIRLCVEPKWHQATSDDGAEGNGRSQDERGLRPPGEGTATGIWQDAWPWKGSGKFTRTYRGRLPRPGRPSAGELLAETVKAGNPNLNCDAESQLPNEITRKQSSRAKQLAAVPWEAIGWGTAGGDGEAARRKFFQ